VTQADAAIQRIRAVLVIQVLLVPALWIHWYIMWASDRLPDLMATAQIGLLMVLISSLVPLYVLRKRRFTHNLAASLLGAAWFAFCLPVSLVGTMLLFGGDLIPTFSSFFLLIPATLVLVFLQTHEFEPVVINETEVFDVLTEVIEKHPSTREGFQYVLDYIHERPNEFSPGYSDRLIAYLSERSDEIGLEARARMKESVPNHEDTVRGTC